MTPISESENLQVPCLVGSEVWHLKDPFNVIQAQTMMTHAATH